MHDRSKNQTISWIYFERLEACRTKHDFVSHKMTKKHIQWYRSKMDVRLAAETLSDSVADAMSHLMGEGVKTFQYCEGTVNFIKMMNRVFDVFKKSKEEQRFQVANNNANQGRNI